MWLKRLIFFVFCISSFLDVPGQDKKAGPKDRSIKSEHKVRKELRRESAEKRRKERAERKAIKQYHKGLQTKKVRKRMKSSKRTAVRYNEHKRESFIRRLFKKKRRI